MRKNVLRRCKLSGLWAACSLMVIPAGAAVTVAVDEVTAHPGQPAVVYIRCASDGAAVGALQARLLYETAGLTATSVQWVASGPAATGSHIEHLDAGDGSVAMAAYAPSGATLTGALWRIDFNVAQGTSGSLPIRIADAGTHDSAYSFAAGATGSSPGLFTDNGAVMVPDSRPLNPEATVAPDGSVAVTWADAADGGIGYRLDRGIMSSGTTWVVDNPQASFAGTWNSSALSADRYGANYHHDGNAGQGTKSATYDLPVSNISANVDMWWPALNNRAGFVPITVHAIDGDHAYWVDQRFDGGRWNRLGTHAFGTNAYLRIGNSGANGYVIADALRLSSQDTYTWETVATVGADAQSFTNLNVPAGTYVYRVSTLLPSGHAVHSDSTDTAVIEPWMDTLAPYVTARTPAKGATDVPLLPATLTATFDAPILEGTAQVKIYTNGSELVEAVAVDGSHISGKVLTIDMTAPLVTGETYRVVIEPDAVRDMGTNAYDEANGSDLDDAAGDWTFTMAASDANPPTAVLVPTNGAVAVDPASDLAMVFNEWVRADTGSVTLAATDASDTRAFAVTTLLPSPGATVTIDPGADLRRNKTYEVTVPATGFADAFGNHYAPATWRFQTEVDVTPPTVTTYTPANGEADVAVPSALSLTFNENVEAGAGTITITNLTDGTAETVTVPDANVTFTGTTVTIAAVTANLAAGKNYAVRISSGTIMDYAGVPYLGIADDTTWAFDTDVTPPSATFNPADEAIDVSPRIDLVLTFDEDVELGNGNITVQSTGDSRTIDVTSPAPNSLHVSGNVVTIGLDADLTETARYTVTIDSGAIRDLAGNAYGITDADAWNFTTDVAPLLSVDFNDAGAPTETQHGFSAFVVGIASNRTETINGVDVRLFADANFDDKDRGAVGSAPHPQSDLLRDFVFRSGGIKLQLGSVANPLPAGVYTFVGYHHDTSGGAVDSGPYAVTDAAATAEIRALARGEYKL